MPKQYYIKSINQPVILADTPFASGGEGELYDLLEPKSLGGLIAKIYYPKKLTAERESKIDYLIQNPPSFFLEKKEKAIPWPVFSLYNQEQKFVGFLMPKAKGESLEILCAPKLPKYLGKEWQRLQFEEDNALRLRLKICYNIAVALQIIHQSGHYVLVDLKPDNILIQHDGRVALVDIDSIEVVAEDKTLFAATVATPEYTPAEYYTGTKPGEKTIHPAWDRFSLAVVFYRLLYGVHPFAATAKAPYQDLNALGDKIKEGLFVHNPLLKDAFEVVPPLHQQYLNTDSSVQDLFQLAFVAGHENPLRRPKAEEWLDGLAAHPLLLTNRPLPSAPLGLKKINEKDWYKIAVNDILKEKKLLPTHSKSKEDKALVRNNIYIEKDTVLEDTIRYYKKIPQYGVVVFNWVKYVLLFVGVVIGTILIFDDTSWLRFLKPIIDLLVFDWTTVFSIIFSALVTIAFLPIIFASFKQFWNLGKAKLVGNKMTTSPKEKKHSTWQTRLAFTLEQKIKRLESVQYTLYSQRSELKNELRKVRSDLNLLNLVKAKKETDFYQKNIRKIKNSNAEIKQQLQPEITAVSQKDNQAKEWMKEEAMAIKKCQVALEATLSNNVEYDRLKGKTPEQKISYLKYNLEIVGNNHLVASDGVRIEKELRAIEKAHLEKIAAIQQHFDEKHQALKEETVAHKIKVDSILDASATSVRKALDLDNNLFEGNFKKQLKQIKIHYQEITEKEEKIAVVNTQIKKVKSELKSLKK